KATHRVSGPVSCILPEVGLAIQPIMLSKVVLPDPLGPLSTVILRESIDSVTPSSAVNSLGLPLLKTFLMSESSITSLPNPDQRMRPSMTVRWSQQCMAEPTRKRGLSPVSRLQMG